MSGRPSTKRLPVVCAACSAGFVAKKENARYCSKKCQGRAWYKTNAKKRGPLAYDGRGKFPHFPHTRTLPRTCLMCGKHYLTSVVWSKYCTPPCRRRHERIRATPEQRAARKRWNDASWARRRPEKIAQHLASQRAYAKTYRVRASVIERTRELLKDPVRREKLRASARKYFNTPRGKAKRAEMSALRKFSNAGRLDWIAWEKKLKRLGGRCQRCGATERIEIDHIIPLRHKGTNDIRNLQPLCRSCNRSKCAKIYSGSQLILL